MSQRGVWALVTVPNQREETENVRYSAFLIGLQDLLYELPEENHSTLSTLRKVSSSLMTMLPHLGNVKD